MNSELKILKKIWENHRKACIGLISKQIGFGTDYTRYICNCLFKKGKIKPIEGKRDCYELTSRGERGLKLRGIIKSKISKKVGKLNSSQEVRTKESKEISVLADEKKLNLGRAIEKAVSFLKRSIKEER